MQHDRRLIEDSLPLEAISYQSAREKSIRHGHISTLHIWWARRPLAAMRAAIFASLIPAPETDEERQQLHRLIGGTYNAETSKWEGGIVDWDSVKNGNDEHIKQAQELIKKYYPDAPPKVLDPFMGGGSTGLEALRLGAEAYGVELNPVAHLIELCTLVYPQRYGQLIPRSEYEARSGTISHSRVVDRENQMSLEWDADELINPLAEDVQRWGTWVLNEAHKEIGQLYEDTEGRTVVGYIWARTAKCPNPNCLALMPMVRQWWLARKTNRKIALLPIIDRASKTVDFEVVRDEDIDYDPGEATMQRGNIRCLVCGQSPEPSHLKTEGQAGRLGAIPMAIILEQSGANGKDYRKITPEDRKRFAEAKAQLEQKLRRDPGLLPDETVPLMSGTFNAPLYGLDRWGDLFNERQALALITFVEQVRNMYQTLAAQTSTEYARAVATYLSLAVDRMADYNSTLCQWANHGEYIGHTFTRQALPMIWDYAEVNPFSGSTGDWSGALDWMTRVIEHAAQVSDNSATIQQGDATRLPYSDQLIDAVVTDPPYYNAVPYADLSDFFYVWQKRAIGDLYPEALSTPLAPKSPEITEMSGWDPDRYAHKDKDYYETKMTQAFSEANRVLKSYGIFVVVFAHKSTSAWETLINSLLQDELLVTASWPLHTEMGARLRAQGSGALASSIFIVCRKRVTEEEGFYDDVRDQIRKRIGERLEFFWKQGIRGADFFISAIGPAVEVFGRYSGVRKLTGETVEVGELLDIVQESVADYTLGRILNGRYRMGAVDGPTRFYVMYRWSYGKEKIPFDDARRLAQALGTEVDNLIHRLEILNQRGEDVELVGPMKRSNQDRLGEPGRDGMAAPIIDTLHRALLLWRSNERRELAEFLAAHASGREDSLQAVAQALINVLPDGDREKQLLEGYLAGQDNLPDVPRQNRLFD